MAVLLGLSGAATMDPDARVVHRTRELWITPVTAGHTGPGDAPRTGSPPELPGCQQWPRPTQGDRHERAPASPLRRRDRGLERHQPADPGPRVDARVEADRESEARF